MPLSHVGLTVSHLPTSTSFFLSALQPLGYRYIGHWGSRIGLGVREVDFFLTQESKESKAGKNHIVFLAPNRAAVNDFYERALTAGAVPRNFPAASQSMETFNASVQDFDGNNIEVMFQDGDSEDVRAPTFIADLINQTTKPRRNTSSEGGFGRLLSVRSTSQAQEEYIDEVLPRLATLTRSPLDTAISSELVPMLKQAMSSPAVTAATDSRLQVSTKTLIGTVLGAAAGAAVAYAMCKSEEESAREEEIWSRILQPQKSKPKSLALPPIPESEASRQQSEHQCKKPSQPPSKAMTVDQRSQKRDIMAIEDVESPSRTKIPSEICAQSRRSGSRHSRTVAPSSQASASRAPESRASRARTITPRSHKNAAVGPDLLPEAPVTPVFTAQSTHSRSKSHRSGRSKSSKSYSALGFGKRHSLKEELLESQSLCLSPPDHKSFVRKYSDLETVLPSDSISCAGWRPRPPSEIKSSTHSHTYPHARSEFAPRPRKHHSLDRVLSKFPSPLEWGRFDYRSSQFDWRSARNVMQPDLISEPGYRQGGRGRVFREGEYRSSRMPIRSRSHAWDPRIGHYA